MVIDSSAVLAILLDEPDAYRFARAIRDADQRVMSAATLLETSMVLEARKGASGGAELDVFVYKSEIEIVSVDADQAEVARAAWRRFGKGNHPSKLNFGDLFAYALASSIMGLPLLFKGGDFALTDIASALPP